MADLSWWDEDWDVVVAGGGGAGLMAAIEAAERGARVLLVEKQPGLGGATGISVGTLSASGTALQKAAGIQDSVDSHFEDYLKFRPGGSAPEDFDLELTRLLIERAPDTLAWMIAMGVEFSGPHPEPPHTVYRMHNVVPDSSAYVHTLSRAAEDRAVTIRTGTIIQELQRDDSGAVTQIVLRNVRCHRSTAVIVHRGVVLATGYFSANDELARAHGRAPELASFEPIIETATGDGIMLATTLGAATAGMDASAVPAFRTILPPYARPEPDLFQEGAILVNSLGRRFTNELQAPEVATNRQPRQTAHVVFDSCLAAHIATADEDSPNTRDGWHRNGKLFLSTFPAIAYAYLDDYRRKTEYFFEADSPGGLARQMQVPEAAFEEELRRFNGAAGGRGQDPFGREPVGAGVSEPPFYAVGPIRPSVGSGGGLKVDRDMHVLHESGRPIRHLYAAGMNGASNTLIAGHGHALSWAFTTGRIAGANASAETPRL